MAQDINPYAPPVAAIPPVAASPAGFEGLWRQGNVLVADKRATFPNICLKSGEPTELRLKRQLSWHHPAIALTILAGVLVYVILAIVLTQRASYRLPFSQAWLARRKQAILLAWLIALGGIGLLVAGIALANEGRSMLVLLIPLGIGVFLVGLIYGNYAPRLVYPKKIDGQFVWLKGVSPQFLDLVPPWPYSV